MTEYVKSANNRALPVVADYSQLLSGAHRKPATPVGAPSLVAHFAFWQPIEPRRKREENGLATDLAEETSAEVVEGEVPWNTYVDEYIRSLYCHVCKNDFNTPNTEKGAIKDDDEEFAQLMFLFEKAINLQSTRFDLVTANEIGKQYRIDRYFHTRYQSVSLSFTWTGLRVTLRFERHQEYLTLTVFIDLSLIMPVEGERSGRHELESALREFANDIEKYRNKIETSAIDTVPIDDDEWRKTFSSYHTKFYVDIWADLMESLLMSRTPLRSVGVDIDGTVDDSRKKLGRVFADFRGLIVSPPHPDGKLRTDHSIFQMPGWRRARTAQKNWLGSRLFGKAAHQCVQELWPFVTSEPLVPLRRKEFTVSRMLDGHAIYATALGAQPSPYLGESVERQPDQVPVYYLAFVTTFSQWQIGRLLDRINHLGTVRIAAIQELRDLVVIGNFLRKTPVPQDAKDIVKTQRAIADWDENFAGGLNYRIERSRYYVKQFNDGLGQLRIRRVEGYQPYDLFVLRRLESTFDFIDRLGMRLERFRSRVTTSAQALSANTLVALQKSAVKHLKESENIGRTLVRLQQVGEGFLWFAIGPYYVISIIDHFYRHVIEAYPGVKEHGPHIALLQAVIWIGFVSWGAFRMTTLWRRERSRRYGSKMVTPPETT